MKNRVHYECFEKIFHSIVAVVNLLANKDGERT